MMENNIAQWGPWQRLRYDHGISDLVQPPYKRKDGEVCTQLDVEIIYDEDGIAITGRYRAHYSSV